MVIKMVSVTCICYNIVWYLCPPEVSVFITFEWHNENLQNANIKLYFEHINAFDVLTYSKLGLSTQIIITNESGPVMILWISMVKLISIVNWRTNFNYLQIGTEVGSSTT